MYQSTYHPRNKKLYTLVKDLLTKYPELRDSDKKLIWEVWRSEGFVQSGFLTLTSFMDKRLTIPETIRRLRQKLQELNPELRSSKTVQDWKNEKRKTKGTFIYREYTFDPIQQKYFFIEKGNI